MKKTLIIGSFPAPYRIEVFRGLCSTYDADVFFVTSKDQNRSSEYFVGQDKFKYYLLDCKLGKEYFKQCCSNLRQYDFVVAYDWYLPKILFVELLCIIYKIPYFINCDGAFIDKERNLKRLIKRFVKSFFVKHALRCFASGIYAKKYFLYHGAKEKNIVLHKFTSLEEKDILKYPVSDDEKIIMRDNLNLGPEKMVLSVGQFIHRKGYDILLKVWKNLQNDYQLVIIGGGSEFENYKEFVAVNELKNVHLMTFLPKQKIYEYYLAADIFVLLTREDIWGLVINEAMANALPIISSDRCIAALEMVKDNGEIVSLEDEKKIGDIIRNILEDDRYRNKLALNSLATVSEYTIEKIWNSHIKTIDTALSEGI